MFNYSDERVKPKRGERENRPGEGLDGIFRGREGKRHLFYRERRLERWAGLRGVHRGWAEIVRGRRKKMDGRRIEPVGDSAAHV
ncbi:MAG TPA: hypothetical protein VG274_07515, partial [Rhizomicrobium sp.]|nr:hypothetical protein [Rhizomicrobium sp.]